MTVIMVASFYKSILTTTTLLLLLLQYVKAFRNYKHHTAPFFHETSRNVTVYVGEPAILKCSIENLGPRMVNWRKLSVEYPLTVGDMIFMNKEDIDIIKYPIRERVTGWDLVIKRVEKSDEGKYECQVSSKEPIKYVIQLTVLDGHITPIPNISIRGTTYVNLYQRINLTCNATGVDRAPEDIDWFHKGHRISQKTLKWRNRFQIVNFKPEVMGRSLVSRLLVDRALSDDQGVYVCRSSDRQVTSIIVHVLNAERNPSKKHIDQLGGRNPRGQEIKSNDHDGTDSTGSYSPRLLMDYITMVICACLFVNVR